MSDPRSMQTPSEGSVGVSPANGSVAGASELPAAAHQAVARGAVYRLVALSFRGPDAHWLEALEDAARDVAAVGFGEVPPTPEDASLAAAITRFLDALPDPELVGEIGDSHRRLFGHTVAGQCPLYETEYGQWAAFQQPHTLADLAGTYRAFGLVPSDAVRERPDHVSLECEFLYVLSQKEAWAHQHDGAAEVAVCIDARRLFLAEHLARWAPALANRLTRQASDTFYPRLGELLSALIGHECRTLGVRTGDSELAVGARRLPVEDACGPCSQGSPCLQTAITKQEGEGGA